MGAAGREVGERAVFGPPRAGVALLAPPVEVVADGSDGVGLAVDLEAAVVGLGEERERSGDYL